MNNKNNHKILNNKTMDKELEVNQEFLDKVNKSKDSNGIIVKTFEVLDTEKKSRTHRYYPIEVVSKWKEHEDILSGQGIDLEYAVEDQEIDNEFLTKSLSCGAVVDFGMKGSILTATVKFKQNDLTKNIYEGKIDLDSLTVIPKGKGSVKNQRVQDDFELFGFNLVLCDESSFNEEKKENAEVNA